MSDNITYVGGTFDVFHPGHVKLLRSAASFGPVTVSLNRDEFVERYKGRRPVMTIEERHIVVSSCRFVEKVIVNTGDEDSSKAILASRARIVLHGDDWTGEAYLRQLGIDRQFLKDNGIAVVHVPYTKGISTTDLIHRMETAWA